MTQIFISYRRADSHAITDRIQDRLVSVYGAENVFQDVEDIPPGANFKEYIEIQVGLCDVLLVIIGPRWLEISDENNRRRLDNPSDFVRIEIESGLKRKEILVVPVLVQNANMPLERDLPPEIRDLHYRNAIRVRNNPDFERDIQHLLNSIDSYVKGGTSPKKLEPVPARSSLPMILTAVGLVALIAAFIVFGLPALQGAVTPTPNATATAQALAAAQTSTAAPTFTITPTLAPSATATPDQPSATPSPTEEITEEPTVAPTATVLYPEGNQLDLYYNENGFYLHNASTSRLSSSLLRFRALNADGVVQRYQFFGSTWAGFGAPSINPNACVNVEILNSTYERPDECRSYAARTQESRVNTPVFWVERATVTQFAVYWDNEEVGRCQIVDQSCTVYLP